MIRRNLLVGFIVALAIPLMTQPTAGQSASQAIGNIEYVRPELAEMPPVKLDIWQQGGALGVNFVKPDPNGIEIEMGDGKGSVVVFWDFMDEFQISFPRSKEVADAFRISDPELRAEKVGPIVEPLFPLASIPPDSTNIHRLIDQYLDTLQEIEDWEKIYDLSYKMFLDKTPTESIGYFFTAAKNLFLEGKEDKALDLINQLIAARPIDESRRDSLEIAAQFMEERLYEPALRLFQFYAPHSEGERGKVIRLTCAYLNLELGEEARSNLYIKEADAMEGDSLESKATRRLIAGVKANKANQADDALNEIGFALSVIDPSNSLRVIALYYNYLTYQQMNKPEISDGILKEMMLLFGNSAYTKELVEAAPTPSSPIEPDSETENETTEAAES